MKLLYFLLPLFGLCHDFKICSDAVSSLLYINSIDIIPDPPLSGSQLNIDITCIPTIDINSTNGEMKAKAFGVQIISEYFDICDYTVCPMKKGDVINVKFSQNIPSFLPQGVDIDINLDSKTEDGEEITCLDLSLKISNNKIKLISHLLYKN